MQAPDQIDYFSSEIIIVPKDYSAPNLLRTADKIKQEKSMQK